LNEPSTRYQLIVATSPEDLARQAAEQIASGIDLALAERDRAQIALAGGETPRAAYALLAEEHLPWERVDVLLGDERWVPADDPSSNARMLRETLLAHPPASHARFHPVPTDRPTPQASAEAYAAELAVLCPGARPRFDVLLLGLAMTATPPPCFRARRPLASATAPSPSGKARDCPASPSPRRCSRRPAG